MYYFSLLMTIFYLVGSGSGYCRILPKRNLFEANTDPIILGPDPKLCSLRTSQRKACKADPDPRHIYWITSILLLYTVLSKPFWHQ